MTPQDAANLAAGLLKLLTSPLRVLQDIIVVEQSGAFLYSRVVVLQRTLQKIQSAEVEGDEQQMVISQTKKEEWEIALQEFATILGKAGELAERVKEYKGRARMWIYAKALKTSLIDSHKELNSVSTDLTALHATLFGEEGPSEIERLLDQLRQISWQGRPVELVEGIAETLARSSLTNEDCIRYNNKKLEFLQKQMVPLQALEKCMAPARASPQAWTDSMKALKTALESAEKFISSHKRRFNIQTFYTTYYAKEKIEKICKILKSIADEYEPLVEELAGVQILDEVPQEAVHEDRDDLHKKLSFVLKGDQFNFPPELKEEWEGIKREHEERVKKLKIINTDEIDWHGLISGDSSEGTYSVHYYGAKATAKRMTQDGADLEIEDFAKFFTEAAIIESMSVQWVARLSGISLQGVMVVEGGDKDLMQWYKDLQHADWKTKVRVMWEAAQGLKYVHDQEVIHRSVSSHSYVVFPGDSIKITNFSSATELTEVKTLSQRRHAALPRWIAPEIYDASPHSKSTDVFSFGVVMHEVAAMCQPYGLNPTLVQLSKMKLNGDPPCTVPGDCPQVLRDLMTRCCSSAPGARPTMAEVADRLADVKTMLGEGS